MKLSALFVVPVAAALVGLPTLSGCSTAPKSEADKASLHDDVQTTLKRLYTKDPGLEDFVNNAYGYALFPVVGKGGLGVGGAYGRGELYEQGRMIGYTDISQATIGLQAGGQSFAELIVFEDQAALERFKGGKFAFSANASAVALKSGVAKSARYTEGVAVFIEPQGGLMAEASVGGQSFTFQPQ